MKTAAAKPHTATKTKAKVVSKPRTRSVSSNSSDSLASSRSSSLSSPGSRTNKGSSVRKTETTSVSATATKKEKKPAPSQLAASDRDSDIAPTRKSTRSTIRKSRLVTSRLSDSDSDTGSKLSSISKSPTKKVRPKGPPALRKPKNSHFLESSAAAENEERTCPYEGCDSSGHMSGRHDKHFTLEACPVYHNVTPQQCKELHAERLKKDEERKKALANLKPHHATQPTPEQKEYRDHVRDIRSKFVPKDDSQDQDSDRDKEPDLCKWSNKYDLELFQEAQAVASEAIEEELKLLPNIRCTKHIEMGKFEMEVWYQSPYPDDYARLPKLYLCEYCLRYMKSRVTLERHCDKCVWRHPPGEEVYRKDKISVWEVDGKRYKSYCQNLCLLAKFFLDHKTLYYDVEPFLFYVMTISDAEGCHTVGYFSKEKNSFLNYNVSCILTLPPYQRQGYGRLLIDFSYLLTRVEGKIGSPEKPLSDLGLISYRSYWKDVLLEHLCNLEGKQLSIKDMSQDTAINSYDIVSTLQALGMMKYWKGKHIILKKQDVIDEYSERSRRRGFTYKEVHPSCLRWTPFVSPDTPLGTS
ncbi:MOZ/SAS family [Nesidiocoris tenuis]|uniref:Histone acetyltransferase n=1 Tax=Nesidiocoris tenuis TaxID=355587 RepID=A0ABN7A607_9HEMI|nr:MOZ/SAS family [Nesidiocoris tenuis]